MRSCAFPILIPCRPTRPRPRPRRTSPLIPFKPRSPCCKQHIVAHEPPDRPIDVTSPTSPRWVHQCEGFERAASFRDQIVRRGHSIAIEDGERSLRCVRSTPTPTDHNVDRDSTQWTGSAGRHLERPRVGATPLRSKTESVPCAACARHRRRRTATWTVIRRDGRGVRGDISNA
ncbi:uncharacterized protein LAESUDRAFT_577875 [Laetiporus sulphureus 93-53]|uniref:Uncharacterized protein n=1 Tax=Laetiporus sulphureus 93-53 TaxID=1314785 RepID=A0A165B169_9APHY|nr:uncharacterized protein LAESUDRAFT_577875 [Laetiporus sulphureus 93-53]KZT00034.1 hypothetical protein LAESUDRAFT_577875 [Laetiporus sulphureus 93-53]